MWPDQKARAAMNHLFSAEKTTVNGPKSLGFRDATGGYGDISRPASHWRNRPVLTTFLTELSRNPGCRAP